MIKHLTEEGTEIEVFTAEEVKAQIADESAKAVKAKETEFGTVRTGLETELADAKKALGERAGEFKQFRELHKDVVDKLTVAERTIYENQKLAADNETKRIADDKKRQDAAVDSALRSKAGTDEKLFTKMKETWGVINVNAATPEEVDRKIMMVLGAIQTTQPDLLANVTGFSGGYMPPRAGGSDDKTPFAETERGKAAAAELGLTFDEKKK